MSELVPQSKAIQTVSEYLMGESFRRQVALALPHGMQSDRMVRIALTEIRRTPKLAQCRLESLLGAVMQCAQLGLEPGPMGLAYLIPYGDEAQLQLGYRGMLALVWRSEQIASVQAEVVYDCDEFAYSYGIPPRLHHIPASQRISDAKPTHVYAVIGTSSGGWIFRVMTYEEIEKHRQQYSKATKKDTPWQTAWDEMACKTILKRTCKRAPISAEAQRAISLDDQVESGIPQKLEIDVTPVPATASGAEPPDRPPPCAKPVGNDDQCGLDEGHPGTCIGASSLG